MKKKQKKQKKPKELITSDFNDTKEILIGIAAFAFLGGSIFKAMRENTKRKNLDNAETIDLKPGDYEEIKEDRRVK